MSVPLPHKSDRKPKKAEAGGMIASGYAGSLIHEILREYHAEMIAREFEEAMKERIWSAPR